MNERTLTRRAPRRRRVLRLLLSFAAGCFGLSLLAVLYLRIAPPLFTSFMMHAKLTALFAGEHLDLDYRWVGWKRLSPNAALAVVAAEDQLFPVHRGFDFAAMQKAVDAGQRGRKLRGASTITQQLAKNLFLWPGRSWIRKGIEAYFTVLLETILPKRRILELYLNVVEVGPGIFGVEAAAQRFFGKSAATITGTEAARLAAVLPNPHRLHVDHASRYVTTRAARIEKSMAQLGSRYLRGL